MPAGNKADNTRAVGRAALAVSLVLLICSGVYAHDLEVRMRHIDCPIIVDGLLEPCWHQADSIIQFIQYKPNAGELLSEPTTVYFVQDENAIYVSFSCVVSDRSPDCRSGSRESMDGDVVIVFLDTFNDRRNAYRFSVNAAGVQGDAVLSENGLEENINWDGIFQSAVAVDSNGYTVEMAIPWSCLRYDEDEHTWGVNFGRKIPRNEEVGYFAPVMFEEAFTVSNFARLVGVQPARRSIGIEVYPYAFYRWEDSYGDSYQEFQPSVDLNWTATAAVRLQSTFNPDFSQVEADPFAFNLSKYALYFEEKRAFFVEGQEYFQPSGSVMADQLELFYSRQIGKKLPDGSEVPLVAGARIIGRHSKLEYGSFLCHTESRSYEDFFGETEEPTAYFGVNRVRYPLSGNSTIGILHAGKYTGTYRNDVFSLDGSTSTSTMEISYQIARSYREGISDWAYNSYIYWRGAKHFFVKARAQSIGEEFDVSEIGYVPWTGYRWYSVTVGPVVYPKRGLITYSSANLTSDIEREYLEDEYSYGISLLLEASLRNGWGLGLSYGVAKEYEQDISYNPKSFGLNAHSDYSRRFWVSSSFSTWYGFNYRQWYYARSALISVFAYLRSSNRLSFSLSEATWIEERPDGSTEEVTCVTRPSINYSPAKGLSVRVYDEVPFTRSDGLKSHRIGATLRYNFLPKSWLLVAFNDYQLRRDDGTFNPQERIFAVKLKHLIAW